MSRVTPVPFKNGANSDDRSFNALNYLKIESVARSRCMGGAQHSNDIS